MKNRPSHGKLRAPYLYASKRLLTDVYERAKTSNPSWRVAGISGAIPGIGLGLTAEPSADQADNIYWLGELAQRVLPTFDLGEKPRRDPPWYLHARVAPLTWAILRVGGISGPVAWIYGDWHDQRSGRTVIALCGSLENYRELRPGTNNGTTLGWYPSSPSGLASIINAMAEGRESEVRKDMAASDENLADVAHMAVTLTRLPRPHVLASGYAEVLAEVFTFAQNFRASGRTGKIDTFILGAPLWIRQTVAAPLTTRFIPPEFEAAIEEDDSRGNPWRSLRIHLANWIMPRKHFLYADEDELSETDLLSNLVLNTMPTLGGPTNLYPGNEGPQPEQGDVK